MRNSLHSLLIQFGNQSSLKTFRTKTVDFIVREIRNRMFAHSSIHVNCGYALAFPRSPVELGLSG